jgi:hypothetical protein
VVQPSTNNDKILLSNKAKYDELRSHINNPQKQEDKSPKPSSKVDFKPAANVVLAEKPPQNKEKQFASDQKEVKKIIDLASAPDQKAKAAEIPKSGNLNNGQFDIQKYQKLHKMGFFEKQ